MRMSLNTCKRFLNFQNQRLSLSKIGDGSIFFFSLLSQMSRFQQDNSFSLSDYPYYRRDLFVFHYRFFVSFLTRRAIWCEASPFMARVFYPADEFAERRNLCLSILRLEPDKALIWRKSCLTVANQKWIIPNSSADKIQSLFEKGDRYGKESGAKRY
jgi:hypothetical protein